jgi:hypothetical protein
MSFTSPVYGEYGNTQKGADYEMFWSKTHATVRFQGFCTVGTGNKFLKRTNGAQALYIPTNTFGAAFIKGAVIDISSTASYPIFDAATGNVFENDAGTTICTTTAMTNDTDLIVTVVPNDTLDCLEIGILETSGTRAVYVIVDLELYWVNTDYRTMLSPDKYPACGTATVAVAE